MKAIRISQSSVRKKNIKKIKGLYQKLKLGLYIGSRVIDIYPFSLGSKLKSSTCVILIF